MEYLNNCGLSNLEGNLVTLMSQGFRFDELKSGGLHEQCAGRGAGQAH
jgi:hypothetical protein